MVPGSRAGEAPAKPLAAATPAGASHSESLANPALAGRGAAARARLRAAGDPVQRKAARRQRGAKGAADMQAPLAPVETGPAIDVPAGSGAQIHPELAAKPDAGLGHRAALAGQLDVTPLGHSAAHSDPHLAPARALP